LNSQLSWQIKKTCKDLLKFNLIAIWISNNANELQLIKENNLFLASYKMILFSAELRNFWGQQFYSDTSRVAIFQVSLTLKNLIKKRKRLKWIFDPSFQDFNTIKLLEIDSIQILGFNQNAIQIIIFHLILNELIASSATSGHSFFLLFLKFIYFLLFIWYLIDTV